MTATNNYFTPIADLAPGTKARSADINARQQAVNAAFDKVPDEVKSKTGTLIYAQNSGTTANAYQVTLDPKITATGYIDGMQVNMLPMSANTGACTINVNGLGNIPIKRYDGSAPVASDLLPSAPIRLTYVASMTAFLMPPLATGQVVAAAASAAAAAQSAGTAGNMAQSASQFASAASTSAQASSDAAALAMKWSISQVPVDGTNYGAAYYATAASQSAAAAQLAAQQAANKASLNGDPTQNFSVKNLTVATVNGGPLSGLMNRIINGEMQIDQRYCGTAASFAINTTAYALDRWCVSNAKANGGNLTVQRVPKAPTAASSQTYAMKVTNVTASTSLASNDYVGVFQQIEGINLADLAWGTASAKPITIAFAVTASLPGTYALALRNNNASFRAYVAHFTVAAANVEQGFSITVPGDTAGVWDFSGNGAGLYVGFDLGVGATIAAPSVGSWLSGNYVGSQAAIKMSLTAGATFQVTDVRLVAGTVAPPMETLPYAMRLSLCQRYFCKTYPAATPVGSTSSGNSGALFIGPTGSVAYWTAYWQFPQSMRAQATLQGYQPLTAALGAWLNQGDNSSLAAGVIAGSDRGAYLALNAGNTYTPQGASAFYMQCTASAEF